MLFVLYTTFLQQCKLNKLFSGEIMKENMFTVVYVYIAAVSLCHPVYKIN